MAKIAFLHHSFIAGSGIDGVIYELAKRLGKKHDVRVLTFRTDGAYSDVPVTVFKSRGARTDAVCGLLYAGEVRKELEKFDVVATQLYPASAMPHFPCRISTRHVMTAWGVQNIGRGVDKAYSDFLRAMEGVCARRADIVLAGCDAVRKSLEKVRPDAVTLYQYGIDFQTMNYDGYDPRRLEEKYGIKAEDRVLLFVGRNSPHKRIDLLVDMVDKIPDKSVRLAVVGRQDFTENKARLEEQVAGLGIKDRVLFTGVVSRREVVDWYCRCDLFVNASEWEGFLIPEAYAFRKAIVAYDAEPHRETVQPSRGILVRKLDAGMFADAVVTLLLDRKYRKTMGENGYTWVRTVLDYDRIVENWERIAL